MKVTEFDFKSQFEKLLVSLVQEENAPYFSVDKKENTISLMLDDWCLYLHSNGKWEIR